MSQLRRIHWYVSGFFKKHSKILLGSIVAGIVLFLVLPQVMKVFPTIKKTTYIGRVGRFSLASMPRDIQEKVSFGLTKSLESGEVVPALASSYVSEEGGKAYRFTIRPRVLWQDGKPVETSEVNYTFSDVQTARSQNDIVYRLLAKKQDENAQEPLLPVSFLTIVSQPLFRQEESTQFFQKKKKIIGLGEYSILSVVDQGSGIKELTLDSQRERLIYRFYPTEHSALVAFRRGEVDQVEELLDTERAEDSGATVLPTVRYDRFVGLFFNLNYKDGDNTVYANKQLRQALNFALSKPSQNRFLSPISKLSWAYVKDEVDLDHFDQDLSQAVSLLVKTETPSSLNIELQTTPSYTDEAEKIKREWEELGRLTYENCLSDNASGQNCENKKIIVNVRISNFPDLQGYQVMLVGQQIPRDPDQYHLWHSTQTTNVTHYKNPKVDKLLEDGRRTQNREERILLYQEFQRIIVKDSPVIFLHPITVYTVKRN